MTRPPLELLRQLQPEVETLLGFIRGAVAYHDGPQHVESVLDILTQNGLEKLDLLAVCSPHEARREALIHKLMAENKALRAQAEAGQTQTFWVVPALPPEPLPEAAEYHRALMTVACQDTTDYDNAVTETVCDRLLEAITGQGEPSFGGPRLNMIVRLIRDLRVQAEAEREPEPMPAELAPMLRAVIQAGPATWQVTEAMTAEQHGEAVAQMVRDTAERHGLGDEPRVLHWLSVGDDASLAFVGTSPNSPHLARALGGAWNDLVQVAPELLARCAQADAGGER